MPPSVRGIRNNGVDGYDVTGVGRAYEGQEGFQNLLVVSISSIYDVFIFGHGRLTV